LNAPQFLRRAAPKAPPHPVDLDAHAAIDQQLQQIVQRKTEAQVVGDTAEHAVMRATQLKKEVLEMVDKAKDVAAAIEREGLALIAAVQQQQEDFNRRTTAFVESAATLHTGLRDVLSKVGTPKPVETTAELPAATLEDIGTGIAKIVSDEQQKP
jgi:formate-dependent phosphoribosylglycinamide formyltransferase (GAR transformylase)